MDMDSYGTTLADGNLTVNSTATALDPLVAAKENYKYHCLYDPMPNARQIVQSFDGIAIALHSILILMATITVAIFIEQVFYLKSNIKLSYRRRLSMLQAGIPSVFAVTSVMGTFFPGGHVMIDFVTSIFFGLALHTLLLLMVNYFGGLRQMLLRMKGRQFQINTGPFCCCMPCLPKFNFTKKNFYILWYATFQVACLRPTVLFFQGVMGSDRSVPIPGLIYTLVLAVSMLTGSWALVILRTATSEFIAQYRMTAKFIMFQLLLLISNLQPFILSLCYIPCALPYTVRARQVVANYQITAVEFFILALLGRCAYRRKSDNEELPPITDKETAENEKSDVALLSNGDNRGEDIV